jgi:SHS2 domain-containing protein
MQPGYRILDHTADVGLEARGGDLAELFSNAARGMFAIIGCPDTIRPSKGLLVKADADNPENLLVNWLSELLYLSATQGILFCRFDIAQIDQQHISAKALGEPIDQNRHELYTEIKAVTYHDLKVAKAGQIWLARVLFDV